MTWHQGDLHWWRVSNEDETDERRDDEDVRVPRWELDVEHCNSYPWGLGGGEEGSRRKEGRMTGAGRFKY